jgi:hypothetical protein
MKKLINKSIILSLFLALTACNDWLNVSPKTDMKAEDLFSTEAGFRDALIGVYALMATDNLYGKNLSYAYLDVLAQYYTSPHSNTSAGYEHNLKNAAAYNYTETGEESRILSIWSSHFSAIANINQALLFIDENRDVFTSEDIHHIYKGEFLALRALLHFNVLRLFALSPMMDNQNGLNTLAIPYVEQYTNIAQPQLTVKEVLAKIVKDLLAAKDLMREREIFNESDASSPMYKRSQRMNYYAVTALLARVYLYGSANFEVADLSDYNLMNAEEKLEYEVRSGLYKTENQSPEYADGNLASYNQILKLVKEGNDVDWLAIPVRDVGIGHKHSVMAEGGNETFRYALDLSYSNTVGVMKGSKRDNYGGGVRLQYNLKKLKFMNYASFSHLKSVNSPYGSFSSYTYYNPYYNPYDEEGNIKMSHHFSMKNRVKICYHTCNQG